MNICHACKNTLSLDGKPGRRDECPHCRADLYCCLNCTFHDRSAPKQCREPIAELVKDKAKANFCDYFTYKNVSGPGADDVQRGKTRKTLDDLFKK